MSEQPAKPKKLSMVAQSIEAARNAPAFTPEMQAQLDALVSTPMTADQVSDMQSITFGPSLFETDRQRCGWPLAA